MTVGTQISHPCGWSEHLSETGVVYFTDEALEMPRMPEHLLNCAVYVYPSVEAAQEGKAIGGSGFLAGVQTNCAGRLNEHLYAVTNAHVITKAGDSPVLRLNTKNGGSQILKTSADTWRQHPDGDDIAVRSITLSGIHEFYFVDCPHEFLTEKTMYAVGPGTDTVTVGRFITHDGRQRNLPSLRFGNIAMMPLEPIEHPGGYLQESFLIESRSISGYSGSPVFIYLPFDPRKNRTPPSAASPLSRGQLRFIGIDWGHLPRLERVLGNDKKTPTSEPMWVKSNTGMSPAIPAWRLQGLLESEELVMKRAEEDQKILQARKGQSNVVLDSADEDGPAVNDAKTFTKGDFETALKKASRKVTPPK